MASVEDEIEVKFLNIDLEHIRGKLESIGGKVITPDRLMKRIVFGGEANPEMICTYGRIRDEGDSITMSAKYSAVNGDISSQKEAQVVVDDFNSAVAVLRSFGLVQTDYQENRRETWRLTDGTLVELETWPELPAYIEIEGQSIEAIKKVASQLGLSWAEHTTDSTDKLYMSHLREDADSIRKKLQNLKFK